MCDSPGRDKCGIPTTPYSTSLTLENVPSEHVGPILDVLREAGYLIEVNVGVRDGAA